MREFITSTISMRAYHEHMSESRLVRVEYYRVPEGVKLVPVSGHNLEVIKNIKQVTITSEEFNDRDHDYYDDQVEFFWALRKLGFDINDDFVAS